MDLILNSLKISLSFLGNPISLLILGIVAIFFYKKNLLIEEEQRFITGRKVNSAIELTFSQLTLGILAGVLGSMLLSIFRINFEDNAAIELILMISLLLMFYKTRMICFSYSGAILGFLSLFTTYIANKTNSYNSIEINILSLITFVAIMHFVEGILIIIDGFRAAIPNFTIKDGKLIGGFTLKRYWLLPTVIPGSISAILGYSSSTFTLSKEKKALESGMIVGGYAIILLIIAQLARLSVDFKILALILMPITHELMLRYQLYREESREYRYVSDEGISVLDVLPSSPFKVIGLKSGDKILSVNGFKVREERDILRIKNEYYGIIDLEIKKVKGTTESHKLNLRESNDLLLLLVPRNMDFLNNNSENRFQEILENLKKESNNKSSRTIGTLEIKEKEIENKTDEN